MIYCNISLCVYSQENVSKEKLFMWVGKNSNLKWKMIILIFSLFHCLQCIMCLSDLGCFTQNSLS